MKDPKIIQKRQLLETARTNKNVNDDYHTRYKETLKTYKKTVKSIKNEFLRKALSSKNPSIIWRTIDRILTKQNNNINHVPADMNTYYCNLASNLTNKPNIPANCDNLLHDTSNDDDQNLFTIKHTNYDEVLSILKKLKNDCSSGYDNIPVRYLKPVNEYLASPLVNIINNSIDNHIFPDKWKIARVSPVPKIDQPTKLKDYRPISILPVLSKVYERVILSQLCQFIERNSLYCPNQSGFRKGHTTTTLLLKLRDDIIQVMSKSEVTLSLLIDYSKAFDTIDHCTLIEKLKKLNFSNKSLKIIMSYLSNRQQFVQVNDKRSPTQAIHFGVP
ncbi:MAG: reverse transcriptase domain-containing protein, partial [Pseudomonadota bacterium]